MRPVLAIIEQVGRHQPFEMLVIQDDHVKTTGVSQDPHHVEGRNTGTHCQSLSQY
jgi:hypothetical protein